MGKNNKKWLKIGKKDLKETRDNGFVQKDGKKEEPKLKHDRIRRVISPIVFPQLPDAWFPFLQLPHGIEFQIIHAPVEFDSGKKDDETSILHIAADHSGCGWWRLHELEDVVNYGKMGHVINSSLLLPPEYMIAVKFDAIRIQRALGDKNVHYWTMVRDAFNETSAKTRLIYEIDDVVCGGLLPEFNESKKFFDADDIRASMHKMLDLMDEFVVVSPKMREVYRNFHQSVKISVVPNFASHGWFDGFYDKEVRMRRYEAHKKRPRVLISGGATHTHSGARQITDITDYKSVADAIISARHDFEFVIMGVQPNIFRSFVENGEMAFVRWVKMQDYPRVLNAIDVQCSIAPLYDNIFNRAKSSIKWQESCYMGFGFAGQDMEPYADARNRFTTGPELIDLLKKMTKDEQSYEEEIEFNRKSADKYWIDDKAKDILTIYKSEYGSDERKNIKWFVDLNPAQFGVVKK